MYLSPQGSWAGSADSAVPHSALHITPLIMPLCHYSAATIAISSSSSSSTRSLRSKGIINPLDLDSTLNGRKSQKKAAHWTDEQEEALLDFLRGEIHSMGDRNFKKSTYTAAANYLKSKYPIHTLPNDEVEGEKTANLCEHKFKSVCIMNTLWICY